MQKISKTRSEKTRMKQRQIKKILDLSSNLQEIKIKIKT